MALFKSKKSNKTKDKEGNLTSGLETEIKKTVFDEEELKSVVAPDGVNPNPLSYFVIHDAGKDIYVRSFYISKLPKSTTFAVTFSGLLNFPGSTASVFVNPMLDGKSTKTLDRRVRAIETELIYAEKNGDRNQIRKMDAKLKHAEQWAYNIETGNNKLFEVKFLFSIFADNLDELSLKSSDIVTEAKRTNIELVACYAVHPEAYLCNGPFNKVYKANLMNLVKMVPMTTHVLDRLGLAAIYNHTNSYFSHPTGIPAGRNMFTGEPISWDAYAPSHQAYSCIFAGKTGTGKSATIKMYSSRYQPFGFYFACIDSDKKAGRGEYSLLAERLGGVNFQISSTSTNIINPFDIDVHDEYDEKTDSEYKVLRVLDKLADVSNIIMTMIIGEKTKPSFELFSSIEAIVKTAAKELYNEREIYEGKIDSLYEKCDIAKDGKLVDGYRKKTMPTMSDFYLKILYLRMIDSDPNHSVAFSILVDVIEDYVKDLYYDKKTLKRITEEQYYSNANESYLHVQGSRGYYDGQTTISIDRNCPFTNVDISDLPKDDKPTAQQVALNFVNENFIKVNSENPKNARKLVLIIDEAHKMFPYESARRFLNDLYRTARKRYISCWTCTQALADYNISESTVGIIKNTTSIFLFKQDHQDREFLQKNTVLTNSAVDKVISLGGDPNDIEDKSHKGELCLIDADKVIFVKVDYLVQTEAAVVETDTAVIKNMSA